METADLGTLPTVRQLEKAGFQPEQADMPASAFDQIEGFNRGIGRDLWDIRDYVKTHTATKSDVAELRADMAEMKADIFRALWLHGGALAALILTLAGFLLTRS